MKKGNRGDEHSPEKGSRNGQGVFVGSNKAVFQVESVFHQQNQSSSIETTAQQQLVACITISAGIEHSPLLLEFLVLLNLV